jgi:hypothetical protein
MALKLPGAEPKGKNMSCIKRSILGALFGSFAVLLASCQPPPPYHSPRCKRIAYPTVCNHGKCRTIKRVIWVC